MLALYINWICPDAFTNGHDQTPPDVGSRKATRIVSTTEAGERLVKSIGPHFDGIASGLADLGEWRGKPAGSLRITSVEHASQTILLPALAKLLPDYPDIMVEVINDYSLVDIVAERFDAGVRLGEQVAQDMIAVRIGPDFEQCVVGAPPYFATHGKPATPYDLTGHLCISGTDANCGFDPQASCRSTQLRFSLTASLPAWDWDTCLRMSSADT